ncbi:DUF4224 domain-containing protein [Pseudomonas lundensis]|uniref:DUF4224 domain-containing protein n=1 Tax=Serratia proteamaculans TaxID=28151 RepID=UPI002980BFD1|nr:DUF4224 domain-containing protein [Serratia proteamaculans]MDW5499768.1 DUF4224 domain-containing protein [Serratia proteamaculans]MDW5504833.1 DUF4224 domain-containing protein [Pseudomonas lundensis]
MLDNNENELISDSDIERITGYKIASKQCEALRTAGVFFITRRDGKPSTTWGHFNYPVSLRAPIQVDTGMQPNFGALD